MRKSRSVLSSAQVAAELQEPGAVLARLDVPVHLVLAQLVGGEQVPHPGRALIGGPQPPPRGPAGLFMFAADRRPLPARPGLQIQRPKFIRTEDHLRAAGTRCHLMVGDGVQVLDAGRLGCIVRVAGGLPGL